MFQERTGPQFIGGASQDGLEVTPPWSGGADLVLVAFTVRQGASGEVRITVDDDLAEILKGSAQYAQPAHGLCFALTGIDTLPLNEMHIRVISKCIFDFSAGGAGAYLMYYWQRPLPVIPVIDPSISSIAAKQQEPTSTEVQQASWAKLEQKILAKRHPNPVPAAVDPLLKGQR